MIRVKKQKKKMCQCNNCGYNIAITPDTVKEKTFEEIIAIYVECPVCGEKILKQLDTPETQEKAQKGVKLTLLRDKGKKLSGGQNRRLQSIEKELYNKRLKLNSLYWDEIYQSLNQTDEEDEKTEMANQEPLLGSQVTNTVKLGERMAEHEEVL